ncbi:MAG: Fe-S cluster assembly ATPase SufC [Patescibacteria group bacterium]
MTDILEIKNLHASVNGIEILKGINLTIRSGEIHAIMGQNGSGKSTLCNVLMGHPKYEVTKGSVKLNDQEILELAPDQRAHLGLFLGFQHPLEVAGVTMGNFLRLSKNAILKSKNEASIAPLDFMKLLKGKIADLKMDEKFAGRYVNEGFSGGEKKRAEIIQMAILEPKFALLDEIDSGLDIDALKIVAKGINETFAKQKMGVLLITHYQRLLNYITPDFIHIMNGGKIIKSGDKSLALKLEETGYEQFIK